MKQAAERAAPSPAVLQRFCQVLEQRSFRPHPLFRGCHAQTLAGAYWPRRFPWGWSRSAVRCVRLNNGSRLRVTQILRDESAPTLVALHGMGGSSRSVYMQALSHKAYRENWNALLLNLYDTNLNSDPPLFFHAGSSDLLGEILCQLGPQLGATRIFLVGVSMGGNLIMKLLGEWGESFPSWVSAAGVVSPLCDLSESWQRIEALSNTHYRLHYVRGLKNILLEKAPRLLRRLDAPAVARIRTIRQFDEVVTAPLGGFRDADDYYQQASAVGRVSRIRVPLLIIHSRDDPLLPWEPLTRPEVQQNPLVLTCLTPKGGHVGFVESRPHDLDRAWAENRIIDFLRHFV